MHNKGIFQIDYFSIRKKDSLGYDDYLDIPAMELQLGGRGTRYSEKIPLKLFSEIVIFNPIVRTCLDSIDTLEVKSISFNFLRKALYFLHKPKGFFDINSLWEIWQRLTTRAIFCHCHIWDLRSSYQYTSAYSAQNQTCYQN